MKKINSRGAILTFLALLLILSILTLIELENNARLLSMQSTEANLFLNTQKTFSDIENNIVGFDKNGFAKTIDNRSVPFSYTIDENKLLISQTLPLSQTAIDTAFNEINYYRVFATDNNFLDDSTKIDFNSTKNISWGGDKNKMSFLVNPFCVEIKIFDKNTFDFNSATDSNRCDANYNNANLLGFDVNISIQQWNEDYNIIGCNGTNSCSSTSFGGTIGQPTINFLLDDSVCSGCKLSDDNKYFTANYNPTKDNNISIKCNSAACGSKEILIKFGQGLKIIHNETNIAVSTATKFNDKITGFELRDVNAAVSNKSQKNNKSNN